MALEPANISFLIGSGTTVLGTLLGVLITNGFQIWRDRSQWQKQQELERKRWERDKLLEIYTNCISSITAYLQSGRPSAPDPTSPFPTGLYGSGIVYDSGLYGQAEAWLTLLLIYHPAKETQEYTDFEKEVKALDQSPAQLRQLLDKIVVLARTDSRLFALTSTGAALSASISTPQIVSSIHPQSGQSQCTTAL